MFKWSNNFLLFDQIIKRYDENDFNDLDFLKYSFFYEFEKIKTFINCEKKNFLN